MLFPTILLNQYFISNDLRTSIKSNRPHTCDFVMYMYAFHNTWF